MAYFLNLFSPETYEAFRRSTQEVSGFRIRHRNGAERVHPGDRLLCYLTKLSRWFGVLEVVSRSYEDNSPIFYPEDDPFVIRFKVRPLVILGVDKAVPIHEDELWNSLSFTKGNEKGSSTWTGKIRTSLVELDESDARIIEQLLTSQLQNGKAYPFDPEAYEKLIAHTIRRADKTVSVSVPDDADTEQASFSTDTEVRESIRIQALIADVGSQMGLRVWIPRSDKAAVLRESSRVQETILDRLPLNYDDVTLRTIEQIDVLLATRTFNSSCFRS